MRTISFLKLYCNCGQLLYHPVDGPQLILMEDDVRQCPKCFRVVPRDDILIAYVKYCQEQDRSGKASV